MRRFAWVIADTGWLHRGDLLGVDRERAGGGAGCAGMLRKPRAGPVGEEDPRPFLLDEVYLATRSGASCAVRRAFRTGPTKQPRRQDFLRSFSIRIQDS